MFKFGLEASDAIATLPVKLPEDCGAKVTVKDAACPGTKVRGVLIPETLKPVPAEVTAEIVAFEPPVLVRVPD